MAGINTTVRESRKTADKDLDKKLFFESEMTEDLITFLNQLADDFAIYYGATGEIININENYEEELDALLKKNYRNIARFFSVNTRNSLNESIDLDVYELVPDNANKLNNAIAMALAVFILGRSMNITPRIAQTIQNTMQEQTYQYILDQAKLGKAVSNAEIANAVSQNFRQWADAHTPVISTTEVQTLAENSKYIENIEINNFVKQLDPQMGSRKTWITMGDDKVRKSHIVLDGKTIDTEELFITGNGSSMRYAGDMENGANLSDVINCRCTVVYKYNTEIINVYRNHIFRKK